MGLAVLPARLKPELSFVEDVIATWDGKDSTALRTALESREETAHHADWAVGIAEDLASEAGSQRCGIDREALHERLKQETGRVFAKALECSGVFKNTPEGREAFRRFLELL